MLLPLNAIIDAIIDAIVIKNRRYSLNYPYYHKVFKVDRSIISFFLSKISCNKFCYFVLSISHWFNVIKLSSSSISITKGHVLTSVVSVSAKSLQYSVNYHAFDFGCKKREILTTSLSRLLSIQRVFFFREICSVILSENSHVVVFT